MKTNKRPWPLLSVCNVKERIDATPDYQRPAVWSLSQKQLLIDTILRGYDVPKFYWRKVGTKPDRYEVVDGQQRLRAMWSYQNGDFALSTKESDPIDGVNITGLRYGDLPDDLRLTFDTYPLDVVILEDADEDEVREMFLRLQNGTTLKAQEKRNAMPGAMRAFVKTLVEHPVFKSFNFANSRFTHDLVAAQMTLIELRAGPTNIRNADLTRMYEDEIDFSPVSSKAQKIRRTLNFLHESFPTKAPELERYSVVSLYTLASHLLERYVVAGRAKEIAEWFIEFEAYRRDQHKLAVDICDPEIVAYQEKTSHSTDSADSLDWRHGYLLRKLLEALPDLALKDDQRVFTHEQRIALFRRDKGKCQLRIKCEGQDCEWDHWEADHKLPWSKGGKTTVQNGQVACSSCNASKNNAVLAA